MASDQIEYCGDCENLEKCRKLAREGKLNHCKYVPKSKQLSE